METLRKWTTFALAALLAWLLSGDAGFEPVPGLPGKPEETFFLQRMYPAARFPARAFAQAREMARQDLGLRRRPEGLDLPWVNRGPGNIGGRVNTLAIEPGNERTVYAGFSAGGVFKTEDAGINWRPVFDDQPFLAIGKIAISPFDSEEVYVGTGDPNISGYPFIGNGLFRSRNGGSTWEHLGLEATRIISDILIHPRRQGELLVSAMGLPFERNRQRGIYRSTDGGASWTQVLFVSEQAGVIDLAAHPDHPDLIFAASWDRIRNNRESVVAGPHARVWRSRDGGQTWEALGGGLPTGTEGRIGLAIAPSNPSTVYALYVGADSELKNIYRSDDNGFTWRPIINWQNTSLYTNVLGGFGWYFGKIRVHPENHEEVFLLGVRLWRSPDGGKTWERAAQAGGGEHVDNHDLQITAANNMYLATDGGIYYQPYLANRGGNGQGQGSMANFWTDFEDIPATQFYHTAYNPHRPSEFYGGAQDNGLIRGSDLNGWLRILTGDGFTMAFHPENHLIWHGLLQNGAIFTTTSSGSTWIRNEGGLDRSDRFNWDTPFLLSSHDPLVLFTATHRMYQQTGGPSARWRPVSGDLTRGNLYGSIFHTVSAIAESPLEPGSLLAGTTDGLVWRGTEQGGWQHIDQGLPEWYVTSVTASGVSRDRIFVTHSGYRDNDFTPHIHRSDDGGNSWTPISGNLPPVAVNDLLIYPGTGDSVLFAATDAGVYATIDAGTEWVRLGEGLPDVAVYDLDRHIANDELLAATFARSLLGYPLEPVIEAYHTQTEVTAVADLQELGIVLYPNPARTAIRLEGLDALTGVTALEAHIYDLSGKRIHREVWSGSEARRTISCASWPAGIYTLQLRDGVGRLLGAGKLTVVR